jgi:hypothetical protein
MRHQLLDEVQGPLGQWHNIEYEVEVDAEDFVLLEVYVTKRFEPLSSPRRRRVLDRLCPETQRRLKRFAEGVYSEDQKSLAYAGHERY